MRQLDKNDLAQMNRNYFQSLEKERLVEVAMNLHKLAVEQWEKLQQNSQNSSRPPSSDNPYQKADLKEKERTNQESTEPETKLEGEEISAPIGREQSTPSGLLKAEESPRSSTRDSESMAKYSSGSC